MGANEVNSIRWLAEKWWENNKSNGYFSGCIQHMEWNDLWSDAQENIITLFCSANQITANRAISGNPRRASR